MYQLLDIDAILRLSDNICVQIDDGNVDYQEYQNWLAEGNQPLPYVPPVVVDPPNWEGLVAEVMSNPEFKAAWIAAAAIDPTIAWSLPTAFGMVGQGHPGNFINLFNAICALAQVSPEQRGIWADIGATYNAPSKFLDIVRGVTNGE